MAFGVAAQAAVTDRTADFKMAPGFRLDHLHKVAKEEGSWVALTVDGKGRLIAADQYGKLYRVTPPPLTGGDSKVEPLPIPIGGAHGLLWNKGILYVSVNERSQVHPVETGVWMVKEAGDGWEAPKLAMPIKAGGEHGIHSLVLSPDGEWVYLVAGNDSQVPEITDSFPAKIWQEDQLLPRNRDGRGHAVKVMAPAGWVARFKLDGSNWQLVTIGHRNTYGIAFHDSGELLCYDSDMEWDMGMPWYRPTRICHLVPGAEFGWRNGSGKWPEYYEDSMAPLLNIGPGSPTGVMSGRGLKAPAKYQQAVYAFDWTFGTIYAIHLEPDGASFKATKEEFIAGEGLPVTGGVVGKDGAFYFATGGRRGESNLWRIVYTGADSTAPQPAKAAPSAIRTKLAGFIRDPKTADGKFIYAQLGSEERTVRFMARAAIERLPNTDWAQPLLSKETNPWTLINGSMALARLDAKTHRALILDSLLRVDWSALNNHQKLNWLRAAGLLFARDKAPDEAEKAKVLAKIDAAYPADERFLNFELARMLCYLEAPGVVARTLKLMDEAPAEKPEPWVELAGRNARYGKDVNALMKNHPPTAQIHYLYCLRSVKGPWAPNERLRAFAWFREIESRSGGASYLPAIEMIRTQIFENGTAEEKVRFAADAKAPAQKPKALPQVKGPGRAWTIDEAVKIVEGDLSGRDKKNGQAMFEAALCSTCHKFGSEGGAQGPDLTNLAGRFTPKDLVHSIIEPSEVISDQYEFKQFVTHDGQSIVGRVLNEQDETLSIAVNPFDFSQPIELNRSKIKSEASSKISPMPPGMINRLNPEELKDLFAYLLGK